MARIVNPGGFDGSWYVSKKKETKCACTVLVEKPVGR
jgi:hypothetical protein